LPVIIAILFVVVFFGVIFYGLMSRGLFRSSPTSNATGGPPASTFADAMKRGVNDGIIGDQAAQVIVPPPPTEERPPQQNPFTPPPVRQSPQLEPDPLWRARLEREGEEQILRERMRQRMARVQANNTALDSPLAVDTQKIKAAVAEAAKPVARTTSNGASSAPDLYSAALQAGLNGQNLDPNGQRTKETFFNSDLTKLGYLGNQVVKQQSLYELKRGSVIPATLITGINSDLPGRITAQVSQSVFDSSTGHQLLIPQGTKLMGRYDSKVSFGQSRVLVAWTDIIFPNGSTLQIGGMAGVDAEGYGGFNDQVDNHYLKTFGSAILLAIIGTGTDLAVPQSSTLATQQTASDAVRRNFADTFGRVAERTIDRNLDVQPTLEIRPGYQFNILVDQDIVFPGSYHG
jgi:type IV secretion system protein VirB10